LAILEKKPFASDTVKNGYVIYFNGNLLSHTEVEKMLNTYAEISVMIKIQSEITVNENLTNDKNLPTQN